MDIVKRICLYIAGSLFRFLIFFGVSIVCFSMIFANQKHLKTSIKDSGVYTNFVPAIIADTAKSQTNSSFPITDPEVQKVIKESFKPADLQANTEELIDGMFAWLKGSTPQPQFSIDFQPQRQQMADGIAKVAFDRLKSKPTCFAIPETLDPFSAGCQPPLTNMVEEERRLSDAIAGPQGLLPDATYEPKDLPKDKYGTVIYERYAFAPQAYRWIAMSPWLVGGVLLLLSAAIVLLNRSKRLGFQQLSVALISSGIALIMTPIIFSYILPKFTGSLSFDSGGGSEAQAVLNTAVDGLMKDFNLLIINITIQLIALGFVIMMAERFTRPVSKYSRVKDQSGVISSYAKKPSASKRAYKPDAIPLQSSEESTRRKPKRTKNKKYRKIPKKEI